MSLSVWVAFIRNFACCWKSFLPENSFWQQPPFPQSKFYPLSITTAIELVIGPTQLAAAIFNSSAGISGVSTSLRDRKRLTEWIKVLDKVFVSASQGAYGAEYIVIRHGLEADISAATTRLILGFWEIVFGIAFLFLVGNSFHIVGPTHPKPLIDALIAMEIGLVYVLYLMWNSFVGKTKSVTRLKKLAETMKKLTNPLNWKVLAGAVDAGYGNGELCVALSELDKTYEPAWRKKDGHRQAMLDEKAVEQELAAVSKVLRQLCSHDKKGADGEGHRTRLHEALCDRSTEDSYHSILEFVYFVLNCIAGYGYLLGILAFYTPEYLNGQKVGPAWSKLLMFNLSDGDADFWGNFFGDLAWTVEPFLILISGPLMKYLTAKPTTLTEEKQDEKVQEVVDGSKENENKKKKKEAEEKKEVEAKPKDGDRKKNE